MKRTRISTIALLIINERESDGIEIGGNVLSKQTEFLAYVRKEGRITIPKIERDMLGIEEGDLVKVKIMKIIS